MRISSRKKQYLILMLDIESAKTEAMTNSAGTRDTHPGDITHLARMSTEATESMFAPSKKLLQRWKKIRASIVSFTRAKLMILASAQ